MPGSWPEALALQNLAFVRPRRTKTQGTVSSICTDARAVAPLWTLAESSRLTLEFPLCLLARLLAVANSAVWTLADLPAQPVASRRVWAKADLCVRLLTRSSASGWTCWLPLLWLIVSCSAPFYSVKPVRAPVLTLPLLVLEDSFVSLVARPVFSSNTFSRADLSALVDWFSPTALPQRFIAC